MKRSVSLTMPKDAVAAFKAGKRKTAVKRTLLSYDHEESPLANFLQGFCTHIRETYCHESLSVENVELRSHTRGKVEINFYGDAYMGCSDAENQYDHPESLLYEVNVGTGELTLTGEFEEERGAPRDEF